jgi:chromosome segregation ATPase
MTAGAIESAIIDLSKGYATISESIKNLKDGAVVANTAFEKTAEKLEEARAGHEQKLAELSTGFALLQREVNDLKGRAEESRKNRWALLIAVLSFLLSLASAVISGVILTYLKKA